MIIKPSVNELENKNKIKYFNNTIKPTLKIHIYSKYSVKYR